MAIPLSRYVEITSGVGAAATVSTRELMGRYFTSSSLLPTNTFREFSSADAVGNYFGFSSEEYLRAAFYFGWISKNITRARNISFARFNAADTAPQIFGVPGGQSVGLWNPITTGAFTITIGAQVEVITGLNFSAAANLAAVAAIIQAAIRASDSSAQFTASTVTFDPTRGSFDFTGGASGVATISIIAGSGGNDIAQQLGWLDPVRTIISAGAAAKTPVQTLSFSSDQSNNFGSFAFLPTLTQSEIVSVATWNLALNIEFMYSVRVTAANASAMSVAVADIGGITLTLAPLAGEYPEQVPMMILAATDYAALNSTVNYMFQLFNLNASVEDEAGPDAYDSLRVHDYAQTQNAGNTIEFYQRGLMMGLPVDPSDQNTYTNELWLKDTSAAAILTLLLALAKVSANTKGRSQILAILQGVINLSLLNGVISVGKPLNQTQKLFIAEVTGDTRAWYQVQNDGYWVDAQIVSYVEASVTKYKIVYTLIYSKDDIIRKVEGRDILI